MIEQQLFFVEMQPCCTKTDNITSNAVPMQLCMYPMVGFFVV